MRTILVCNDNEELRRALCEHLVQEGCAVHCVDDGASALQAIAEGLPDAVVLDLNMRHVDGCEILRRVSEIDRSLPVVVMTADDDDSSREAWRLGAAAVLRKPFTASDVLAELRHRTAAAATRRTPKRGAAERILCESEQYGELLGRSPALLAVFEMLRRIEAVNVPTVLIIGESGTGKELVASAIHKNGPRRDAPYVEIDCAAVPETLIESELFGHEKGSFTDARQLKRGLFEVAGKGTLFLDEIGEMALPAQAKLLRALETRRFKRVGGVTPLALEAGIVAATNRDLGAEVKAGRFRNDLYFRLNVVPISMPPLRARRDDIEIIATHLVAKIGSTLGRDVAGLSPAALAILEAYRWPGNVRELRNVLERAIILKRSDGAIEANDLSTDLHARETSDVRKQFLLPPEGVNLIDVERALVEQALERSHGVRTHAAKLLGVSRFALRYRLEKFGLLNKDEAHRDPPEGNACRDEDDDEDGPDQQRENGSQRSDNDIVIPAHRQWSRRSGGPSPPAE